MMLMNCYQFIVNRLLLTVYDIFAGGIFLLAVFIGLETRGVNGYS
jgi:hypothetical protein